MTSCILITLFVIEVTVRTYVLAEFFLEIYWNKLLPEVVIKTGHFIAITTIGIFVADILSNVEFRGWL